MRTTYAIQMRRAPRIIPDPNDPDSTVHRAEWLEVMGGRPRWVFPVSFLEEKGSHDVIADPKCFVRVEQFPEYTEAGVSPLRFTMTTAFANFWSASFSGAKLALWYLDWTGITWLARPNPFVGFVGSLVASQLGLATVEARHWSDHQNTQAQAIVMSYEAQIARSKADTSFRWFRTTINRRAKRRDTTGGPRDVTVLE